MAISTGELINVINRWEKERDELTRWRINEVDDFDKKNFLGAQEVVYDKCINDLEKIIAASMRCGISF